MTFNSFEYPNELDLIFDKLHSLNLKPIIVGGFVRDFFLGKKSKDIDIEVYGLDDISQLSHILKEFGEIHEVGKSFGVCKLKLLDLDLDFSMPRIDNKISSGHKGFLVSTKKQLDYKTAASRRDFTINSIGYDTLNKKILDPYNGINDIEHKTLRIVDKNSFVEDPLRIFRAMGMVARFDLEVEKNTFKLCEEMIRKNMLNELPSERIYEEIKKVFLKSNTPSLGFEFLKNIGGLSFFSELNISEKLWLEAMQSIDRFITNKKHYNEIDNITNVKLLFVLLSYRLEEEEIISFMSKITHKKNIAAEIINIIQNSKILQNEANSYTLRKIATRVKLQEIFAVLDALNIDTKSNYKKAQELNVMTKPIPKILEGKHLISLGLKPSPLFTKILDEAYENQLHSKFDNEDDAILWLQDFIS